VITGYCNVAQHDIFTQEEVVEGLKNVDERWMLSRGTMGNLFLMDGQVLRDGVGKRVLPRRISPPSVT
jgi:hypothetical protein